MKTKFQRLLGKMFGPTDFFGIMPFICLQNGKVTSNQSQIKTTRFRLVPTVINQSETNSPVKNLVTELSAYCNREPAGKAEGMLPHMVIKVVILRIPIVP